MCKFDLRDCLPGTQSSETRQPLNEIGSCLVDNHYFVGSVLLFVSVSH